METLIISPAEDPESVPSIRSIMAALFWCHKHLLLVDFYGDVDAVTAAHYYGMFKKIHHVICHSSHGLLQQGMITVIPGSMLPAGLEIGYVVTAGGYGPSSLQSQCRTLLYPFFYFIERICLASDMHQMPL